MAKKSSLLEQSIAVLALRSHLNRHADRSLIESGKTYDKIELKVSGKVSGKPVNFDCVGQLKVGEDNPTGATKKPASDKLLACLLDRLPKTRVKALIEEIEKGKELNAPSVESLAIAKTIVDRLSTKGPRAGSVSFVSVN